MGMIVQHNMNAINAYNRLNANVAGLKKASEKLASGYRINRAGDDAAGLAISEKMRSQIKGLNQAVRNSQDGINMIQTYEGAAQETHSILQRMKELATQSANGTYDNATDRAAIQLEFDQLNDELNQIADTDFNGTVVLNGGVMADGTVAKNGEFRYAEGYTETVVANSATDISGKEGHTIVDQTFYDKERADAVYNALGINVADVADKTGKATVNVTFMYDGERWVADTVTDTKGNVVQGANAARLEARPVERTDASGNGGFQVIAGKNPYTSEDIVATNAIFNEMTPVKKGDTVTISFDNTAQSTYAPKNAGIDEETYTVTPTDATKDILSKTEMAGRISFELDKNLKDEAMTTEIKNALDEIDKTLAFEVTYAQGKATVKATGATLTEFDAATGQIKLKGKDTVLGTVKVQNITQVTVAQDATAVAGGDKAANVKSVDAATFAGKLTGTDATKANGAATTVTITYDGDNDRLQIKNLAGDNANKNVTIGGTTVTDMNDELSAYGIELSTALANGESFTVTYTPNKTASDQGTVDTANGTVKFGINIDAYNVVDLSDLTVHAVATPAVATMSSQVAAGDVSVADSFKNSTGVLTYAENLTLQTGARTKDSVNFSFSYNQDGTADMGSLVANLDLSARSTGLNTANLSLANQKDANYAIDQIDKAINKTSMVRATFGSIQNRLEHKITNLTTTAENLTEAESSIRDTDMASEMMNYTKFNILQQAAQSMLAQANQQPQSILQLLG